MSLKTFKREQNVRIVITVRNAARAGVVFAGITSSKGQVPNWGPDLPTDIIWIGRKKNMPRVPVIDIGKCTDCESCIEICPDIFQKSSETGYIEVIDLPEYPEDAILEAISMCPADCISWNRIPWPG